MNEEKKTPAHVELTKDAGKEIEQNGGMITPGMVKQATVTIAGFEIPLWYDLRTQIRIDEEMEMSHETLRESVDNLKNATNTKVIVNAIRIMGNRGLERAGEKVRLTEEWLLDHIEMYNMLAYKIAIIGAMTAGYYMESDENKGGEIDLGLMEIRKKKEKTGSQPGV